MKQEFVEEYAQRFDKTELACFYNCIEKYNLSGLIKKRCIEDKVSVCYSSVVVSRKNKTTNLRTLLGIKT